MLCCPRAAHQSSPRSAHAKRFTLLSSEGSLFERPCWLGLPSAHHFLSPFPADFFIWVPSCLQGPTHLSPPHVLNAMLLSGTGAGPLTFSWPTLACVLSSNRNFSYSPSVCGSAPCSIAFCNPCILLDFSRSTFQGTSHSTSSTSLSFPQSKFLLQGKKSPSVHSLPYAGVTPHPASPPQR